MIHQTTNKVNEQAQISLRFKKKAHTQGDKLWDVGFAPSLFMKLVIGIHSSPRTNAFSFSAKNQ